MTNKELIRLIEKWKKEDENEDENYNPLPPPGKYLCCDYIATCTRCGTQEKVLTKRSYKWVCHPCKELVSKLKTW